MDFMMEIILDILLDGSLELLTEKKLPTVLRLIAGLILGFVYGGLAYLGVSLTVSGIQKADPGLVFCGIVLVGIVAIFALFMIRKLRNRS